VVNHSPMKDTIAASSCWLHWQICCMPLWRGFHGNKDVGFSGWTPRTKLLSWRTAVCSVLWETAQIFFLSPWITPPLTHSDPFSTFLLTCDSIIFYFNHSDMCWIPNFLPFIYVSILLIIVYSQSDSSAYLN
jgi:hypothetical protein